MFVLYQSNYLIASKLHLLVGVVAVNLNDDKVNGCFQTSLSLPHEGALCACNQAKAPVLDPGSKADSKLDPRVLLLVEELL